MNENHALCATPEWAEFMERDVLEPVTAGIDLGAEMLELDEESGTRLADELAGSNVTVTIGDSMNVPFPDESFDSVACFTMLHHVPTQREQFATLREACRVLRPGGVLVGADSLASQGLHDFHEGDTYNPIDPARLLVFLQAAGFGHVMVSAGEGLLLTARKPSEEGSSACPA